MKKITAVLATAAIALGWVALTALPASAHTPSHSVDCSTLSVSLKSYQPIIPAVEAVEGQEYVAPTYETQPNPDYVEAWTEPINHDAVTHIEYEFKHKQLWWLVKWNVDPNWNPGHGFEATGETRVVIDSEAWVENIEHPAVGDPTIEVEVDPGQPAIEAVLGADAKVNTLVVTVDGVEFENTVFGGTFAKSYPFANSYTAHDWSIVVVAWDNSKYNYNASGTTTPCIPEQPEALPPVVTEWVDGEYDCDATEVGQTREVTTTEWVLVEGQWVAGEPVTVSESQIRELTDEEQAENACPEVVVPEEPAVVVPVSTVTSKDSLAFTGDGPNWVLIWSMIGGIVLGAGMKFGPQAVTAIRK